MCLEFTSGDSNAPCLTLRFTLLYFLFYFEHDASLQMNLTLHWRRLETSDWDYISVSFTTFQCQFQASITLENAVNLLLPACREDFLLPPYSTHQAFIHTVSDGRPWDGLIKTAVSPHTDLPAAASADSGSVLQAGRPVSGCRTESDRWPLTPCSRCFLPGKQVLTHTHTHAHILSLHILVCMWLIHMPAHKHKRLVFISLWRLLSAAIRKHGKHLSDG